MENASSVQQANMDVVARAGAVMLGVSTDGDDEKVFADDFVFHYVNPSLPEFAGDHHGLDGLRAFFERLGAASDSGFHNEPHSLTPYGDELVVAYATNTISFEGALIDVDAIVVWRVFGGRVHEAWDIPAVNTVRLSVRQPNVS